MSSNQTENEVNKCMCERCISYPFNNNNNNCCYSGMNNWCDFRIYTNNKSDTDDGCFFGALCFPCMLTVKLLILPCTLYNEIRNKCNHTVNKSYLC